MKDSTMHGTECVRMPVLLCVHKITGQPRAHTCCSLRVPSASPGSCRAFLKTESASSVWRRKRCTPWPRVMARYSPVSLSAYMFVDGCMNEWSRYPTNAVRVGGCVCGHGSVRVSVLTSTGQRAHIVKNTSTRASPQSHRPMCVGACGF